MQTLKRCIHSVDFNRDSDFFVINYSVLRSFLTDELFVRNSGRSLGHHDESVDILYESTIHSKIQSSHRIHI